MSTEPPVQCFGGEWTELKLSCIRDYLQAYMTIFRSNPAAQYYETFYVDAFAGTGYRSRSAEDEAEDLSLFGARADADGIALLDGSAANALKATPAFDHYRFIELDPAKAAELGKLCRSDAYRDRDARVIPDDANSWLQRWCPDCDWTKQRAVVFLDPYATEVEWQTVELVGSTGGIDLWLPFPLGAVNRLLTTQGQPPEAWCRRLDRVFGTRDWRTAFYKRRESLGLFSSVVTDLREADFNTITDYFVGRLDTVFKYVVKKPLILRNSKNVPLFLLCFGAHRPVALKIASSIVGRKTAG